MKEVIVVAFLRRMNFKAFLGLEMVVLFAVSMFGSKALLFTDNVHQQVAAPKVTATASHKPATKPTQKPKPPVSALPAGVPSEQAPSNTKSTKVGGVFTVSYPTSWTIPVSPDGSKPGVNGELTLNQPSGGIVAFQSLTTEAWKQLYGNDPAGHWKGQTCVLSSVKTTLGPIKYTAANGLQVQFYKNTCTGGDAEYLWYVPGKFVALATNGTSDGTHADQTVNPHVVTWMVGHGK